MLTILLSLNTYLKIIFRDWIHRWVFVFSKFIFSCQATDYEYLADDDYVPDDEKHKLDDSEDEDQNLLIPLLRRKTRNKEYEPIKPRVTRQTKKLRNDQDYDEDYLPNRPKQSQKKQVANKDGSKSEYFCVYAFFF